MLPCRLPIEKECNRPECSDGAIPNGINTIKDARMHVLGGTNLILPIEPLPPESCWWTRCVQSSCAFIVRLTSIVSVKEYVLCILFILFLHNYSGHCFASSHIQIWQLVTIHKHCLKYPNIFLVASSLLAQQSIRRLISTEAHIIEKAIDGVRIHSITAECSKWWNISAWLQADYQPHLKTIGDDGNVYPTSLNSTWMIFKSVER